MRVIAILFTIHCSLFTAMAQDTPNARQAKRVFTTAWDHFFGPKGVTFHYKIDILHLYKEEGTSWNKGDMAKSEYKGSKMWNDGTTKYILREKKGYVEIHDPKVNKADEKLQMFKFEPDSYEGDAFGQTQSEGEDEEDHRPARTRHLLPHQVAHQGEHLLGDDHVLELQGWRYQR